MYRSQTTHYFIIVIILLFYFVCIAAAQSTDEEVPTNDTQPTSEENPVEKVNSEFKENLDAPKDIYTRIKDKIASFIPSDEHSTNKRAFDFSTVGDDKIRNFSFFTKVPFKFKSTELLLSSKYNQTFEKMDPSETNHSSEMQNLSDSELQKAKWMFLSESYALGLEGNLTKRFFKYFTLGGQIDYQNGITTEIDPHLQMDIFTQFPLPPKLNLMTIKGGVGVWVAGQQLATKSAMRRSGWHIHIDTNVKGFKIWHFNIMSINTMIEALPRWNLEEFRMVASPEIVIKFKPFGNKFSFVIHGEIEYYHNKTGLTFEPIVDINPWKLRWTQLIRMSY